MKLWKRLIMLIVAIIIALSMIGCTITDADILAKASLGTWHMSPDGMSYMGYMRYLNEYWYFDVNMFTGDFSYGTWTETEFWSELLDYSGRGWAIINWSLVPEFVKISLVGVVRETMPLITIWSRTPMLFMLPICTDDTCNPPLMPTPQTS